MKSYLLLALMRVNPDNVADGSGGMDTDAINEFLVPFLLIVLIIMLIYIVFLKFKNEDLKDQLEKKNNEQTSQQASETNQE